uniref:Synaptoporin-like n=1 Tax=Echeneis naucrates TaxID=173247 RepID=A0A665V2A6_ECHNA
MFCKKKEVFKKCLVKPPLHFIFAICAFATCGGYSGHLRVRVDCADRKSNLSINIDFGYPFRLQQVHFKASLCEAKREEIIFLDGDFSSAAQFFVTVGVSAFLYSLLATIVYVFYQNKYLKNNRGPLVDFIVTIIFSFMWLASSCCWAKSLSDIKTATNPTQRCTNTKLDVTNHSSTPLICLQVFGFVNVTLWIGNIWFVFKETGWYKTGQRYPTRSWMFISYAFFSVNTSIVKFYYTKKKNKLRCYNLDVQYV